MKKDIVYENYMLRNTNYYLLCTIFNLEKQKVNNINNSLNEAEEPDKLQFELELDFRNNSDLKDISCSELMELTELMKEKEKEYDNLKIELNNLKIKMEMEKEFSTHKIQNLEKIKDTLENEISSVSTQELEVDLITKEKEIEKLKKENAMLTINNQQLQFELIRTIKFM
jgi:hypothetical protein